MIVKHSPAPWTLNLGNYNAFIEDADGNEVLFYDGAEGQSSALTDEQKANMLFIVNAVNAYATLRKEL